MKKGKIVSFLVAVSMIMSSVSVKADQELTMVSDYSNSDASLCLEVVEVGANSATVQ